MTSVKRNTFNSTKRKDVQISGPEYRGSTITSKPQKRLSELDENLVKSMSPNDLALHIGSLVKAGQLDQSLAMDRFSELSQSLPATYKPVMSPDDLTDLSYRVQLKNIRDKYTLKFDLKTKGINLYFRGKCKIKIRYDEDVKSFESDEENTFILRTSSLDLMEFEAEGLEEKNAILNVLERFEQERRSAEEAKREEQSKEDHEQNEKETDEVSDLPNIQRRRINLEQSLRVPVYKQVLKEGELEKQGHGKGAFVWPIRYVEIKPGQLAYYKPSNRKQPLNILTLDQTVTIDTTPEGFEIKLAPKREQASHDRSYNFRVSKTHGNYQTELEQWLHAIDLAIQGTNEKEIMMSLCANKLQTRTLSNVKHNEHRERRKSFVDKLNPQRKPKRTKPVTELEPAPEVHLADPNIAEILCQLKQQINHLLLVSQETKNERVKIVFENLSEICKFMENQVRGNPDDNLPFQPLNRVGSVSEKSPVLDLTPEDLEDTLNFETNTREETPVNEDLDSTSVAISEETTIAQFQLEISISQTIDTKPTGTGGSRDPVTGDLTSSPVREPEAIDQEILRKIPDPPPNMQEAIDYFVLIENRPTGNPSIPCCPPNRPEAIKYIKTVILGIPDIPPPPPNLPIVDNILGIDSTITIGQQNSVMRKVPMKPLNWNKIGSKQVKCDSMWIKQMSDLDLDIEKLEFLFKEEKISKAAKSRVSDKPKKVVYLSDKRAMGIDIFLRKTRFNFEDLDDILNNALERESTEEGNKIILQLEELEDLSRYPTEEDNDLFRAVKESPDKMVKSDQFIHLICHLRFYKERVDVVLLMREIPTNHEHILEPIKVLSQACTELNNSEKFVKILGLILRIGNHINSGNNRGNAGGFHLSALSKLITYKGTDHKFSLLHFIVQQVLDRNEELLNFHEELPTVHKAVDASVEGILAEIDLMKQQLNKIKKTRELIASNEAANSYQQFTKELEEFLECYEEKHRELIKLHKELRSAYSQVLVKYGETEAESDEFMAHINDFIRDFKKVCAELIRKRMNEKKEQEILRSKSIAAHEGTKSSKIIKKPQNLSKRSSTMGSNVRSPLAETHTKPLPTIQSEEEPIPNQVENGASKDVPESVITKACEPKSYDNLLLEKKGVFKTEWKPKLFVLSGKQLRCMTTKNELEDKLFLGKQAEIVLDSHDHTIIEIKTKDRDKVKRIRIKCNSIEQADGVLKDFRQAN